MKRSVYSSVVLLLFPLALSTPNASGGWTEVSVGDCYSDVAIGPARNDGVTRIYSQSWFSMREYSFYAGAWNVYSETISSGYSGSTPAIGSARTDGVNRLYISGSEYTYSASSPKWNNPKTFGSDGSDLKLLSGRSDGINRLYVADNNGSIHEYTWTPSLTSYSHLALPAAPSAIHKIDFGDARNDGNKRFYGVTEQGQLCEWSYAGGWTIAVTNFGIGEMFSLVIGKARTDGKNRIYLACGDGHAYEAIWNGSTWGLYDMGYGTQNMSEITLGNLRGEGITSVIVGNDDGRIYEFRFHNGSWVQDQIIQGSGPAYGISIGAGRGDGVTRLYVAQDDLLKEYTYTPTTSAPFAAQLSSNGILQWSSTPGGVYDVEWSSDLTTWRSDWTSLTGIPATGATTQSPVPRFFRVKKRTE